LVTCDSNPSGPKRGDGDLADVDRLESPLSLVGSGSTVELPADDARVFHLADRALGDQLAGPLMHRVVAQVVAHDEGDAERSAGLDDPCGRLDRGGQRLLTQHRQAPARRGEDMLFVPVVRGADEDVAHPLVGEQVLD
jgi:hypothetical protein